MAHWEPYTPDNVPPMARMWDGFYRSQELLIVTLWTDGELVDRNVHVGYLERWEWEEGEWRYTWKLRGRDAYEAENVTHWAPLPELPEVDA